MISPKEDNYGELPNDETEAIEQCVLANRILANEGILEAYGHVSVRNPEDPNTFFQSHAISPELVTREDILKIDLDGKVLTKRCEKNPYREAIVHAEIYKARPDVNAICHNHVRELLAFASTGVPIRPMAHFSSMFYQGVPVYENETLTGMLISNEAEAKSLVAVLGNHRAVLVRNHGTVVVGENTVFMVAGSIYLRDNAILQLQAVSLGEPKYL
jgi:3-hydroxy-2-methylpyridine-4,5-dicarboxylate 4-decarboxylase